MAKIIIIGAGLTGISAAYHLEQKGFFDYALFEKEAEIGGLCGTVFQDGFTFDYTGHYLHASDPYFKNMIEHLVGMEQLNEIQRKSFIYSHDTYTRYPFQINLFGLPTDIIAECIEGYVTRPTALKKQNNFPAWVLKNFGAGFGKHFFFPFQKKIFSYDLKKICASWTGRFVPQTSLQQIIKGSLEDQTNSIGYNASFLYPKRGGIISWVKKIAEQLHNPIYTQHSVKKIDMIHKKIIFTNGNSQSFEQIISTMPLDRLLHSLQEKSSTNLAQAARHLRCNSVVNFNIGVSRPDLTDKHWIYFPESQFPFYRIGFPSNCSSFMTPPGCSSLYGEFSHVSASKQTVANTLKASLESAKKLFNICPSEVVTEKIINISHAYVIYNFWREANLPKLHKALEQSQIFSIGRYGEWKYSSMQEAVLDGKKIADKLIIQPARQTEDTDLSIIPAQPNRKQKEL